jgi:hypothetical protein
VGFTIHILTTDAATPGAGMAYRKGGGPILECKGKRYSQLSAVITYDVTYAAEGNLEHQVWLEGFGIQMAFEVLMAQGPHGTGEGANWHVIIRNDCAPALSCLERGSLRSPKLQGIAERMQGSHTKTGSAWFLYASGEQFPRGRRQRMLARCWVWLALSI